MSREECAIIIKLNTQITCTAVKTTNKNTPTFIGRNSKIHRVCLVVTTISIYSSTDDGKPLAMLKDAHYFTKSSMVSLQYMG